MALQSFSLRGHQVFRCLQLHDDAGQNLTQSVMSFAGEGIALLGQRGFPYPLPHAGTDVGQGQHRSVMFLFRRSVGLDFERVPESFGVLHLLLLGNPAINNRPDFLSQVRQRKFLAEIAQGPAVAAGNQVEERLGRGRKTPDAQILVQDDQRQINAVHDVGHIVKGHAELLVAVLQLLIQRGQFLVRRLQFFVGGLQLLASALQLFVG